MALLGFWRAVQRGREGPAVVGTVEHNYLRSSGRTTCESNCVVNWLGSAVAEVQTLGGRHGTDHFLRECNFDRSGASANKIHFAQDVADTLSDCRVVVAQDDCSISKLEIRVAIAIDICDVRAN